MKLVLQCVSAVSAIVLVGGGDVSAQTSQSEAMRVQPQGLIGTAPQAGSSVAVDGDVLVVGVPGNANPGVNAGAAFSHNRCACRAWLSVFKIIWRCCCAWGILEWRHICVSVQ